MRSALDQVRGIEGDSSRRRSFAMAALSGSGYGVGWLLPIPPLLLVPFLLLALRHMVVVRTRIDAVALGFTFGTCGCLVAASWVPKFLLGEGAAATGACVIWGLTAIWAGGLPLGTLGGVVHLGARWPAATGALLVLLSTLAVEIANGSAPWGLPGFLIGYPLIESRGLAQFAVVAGVPALSALAVTSAFAIVASDRHRTGPRPWLRNCSVLGASWLALAIAGEPLARSMRSDSAPALTARTRLLFVQPNLVRSERWLDETQPLALERVAAFSREALATSPFDPEIVVWPENLLTSPVDAAPQLRQMLLREVRSLGVPVITGLTLRARDESIGTYRSVVAKIDPDDGLEVLTEKTVAVPIFESGAGGPIVDSIRALGGHTKSWKRAAIGSSRSARSGDPEVAPLLCYEALFPRIAEARRGPQTLALLNLADDSWTTSKLATEQLTRFVAFRAIEERLPLVRLAHGGLSAAFDEYGHEILRAPMGEWSAFELVFAPKAPPAWSERGALVLLFTLPGLGVACAWTIALRCTACRGRRIPSARAIGRSTPDESS